MNTVRRSDDYGAKSFKAGMGAEAIKELLQQLDLEKTEKELREEIDKFRRTEARECD